MYLLNRSNGHHVVCLIKPVGVVRSGEITLTDCAMLAMPMCFACLMKTLSQTETARASDRLYLISRLVPRNVSMEIYLHLFCSFISWSSLRIPHVVFIKTYQRPWNCMRNVILHTRKIDQSCCDLNGSFCGPRGCKSGQQKFQGNPPPWALTDSIRIMIFCSCVHVNAVHINKALCFISSQAMCVPSYAFLQHMSIPRAYSVLSTKDQLNRWIKQFQGFGPLPCFNSIRLGCHLFDLPWSPSLVPEGPVFHLSEVSISFAVKSGENHIIRLLSTVLST